MKIPKKGSSLKQTAYARRIWGAQGTDKKTIALDVGYAPSVANSIMSKIESKPGYNNAIAVLARDSGNLAVAVMAELKSRGFDDFSNKDLIGAMNAISGAWNTFNKGLIQSEKPTDDSKNKLRTVILQNIQKQVNVTGPDETATASPVTEATTVTHTEVNNNMDF